MKIHLIDGTYELFRAFYGAPSAIGPDGTEVGAARGLFRSLSSLLREDDVSHVAVAFDHVIESFRNELFPDYKTGEGVDPKLLAQFPVAENVAAALGLTVWPMVEFEADDALATAAASCGGRVEVDQVVICSPDKDLAQCVRGERVVMLDRRRKQTIDESGVWKKWGVKPSSIPDYLALVGDSADGIPGIPRWGAKSAAAILAEYEAIGNIPDDSRLWTVTVRGAGPLAQNLRDYSEEAKLYKRLATLRTDVPLDTSLAALEVKEPDPAGLQAARERLGITDK